MAEEWVEDDLPSVATDEYYETLGRVTGARDINLSLSGRKRETYGIGTNISQVANEAPSQDVVTARRDASPYLESSFLPPVACTGCNYRIDFLNVYSLLRSGKRMDEVFPLVNVHRLCCRSTVMEDPLAVEIVNIIRNDEPLNPIEKEVYRIEDDMVSTSRRISELESRISASSLENKDIVDRLRNSLEEEIKRLTSLTNEMKNLPPTNLNDVNNLRFEVQNLMTESKGLVQPNTLIQFMEKFTTVNKLSLPGLRTPLFDYDGFISSEYGGVRFIVEEEQITTSHAVEDTYSTEEGPPIPEEEEETRDLGKSEQERIYDLLGF